MANREEQPIDLSFVVIGYNEAATLADCFRSVRAADLEDLRWELIYVDGGSSDDSIATARKEAAHRILGGNQRRRAAENRNLGWREARGRYVQFVDGDMALDRLWPKAALHILESKPDVAAVFGRLEERNQSRFYQALQIDWEYPEGEALYCGGAAMLRRETLEHFDGFPEDVAYGEEPYLCWRIRNEAGMKIHHLHARMALHDLAYTGFPDYWKRNIRCGATYAEIAARCHGTEDPFWSREVWVNLLWAWALVFLSGGVAFGPGSSVRLAALLVLGAVGARKTVQFLRRGQPWTVALLYAAHTYASKLSIAYGILRWALTRPRG